MDHDDHHIDHENGSYMGNDGWVMHQNYHSSSQQQSPVFEQNGFAFLQQPLQEGLSTTQPFPPQRMPLLQPSPAQPSIQQLQPLIMPGHSTWPSMMITNTVYPPPAVTVPGSEPALTRRNGKKGIRSRSTSLPRKTLTDSDRRRMCQFAVDNPSSKQTDIGKMFGVERSTVSKVLIKKEKYLGPENGSTSPTKRKGSKSPDIVRTLAMWVKKMQAQGRPPSDDDIRAQANHFASSFRPNNEILQRIDSPDWLQQFKHRNGISQARLNRRASETNVPTGGSFDFGSAENSDSQTPNGISPTSQSGFLSPASLSRVKSEEDLKSDHLNGYFGHEGGEYRLLNSQSNTSLAGAFSGDNASTAFSTIPTSPSTPFAFSPDQSGSWLPSQQARLPTPSNFQRPRSQTFPMLGIDPTFLASKGNDPLSPKYTLPLTAPSSALDAPMEGMLPPFAMDSVLGSPPLHSIHRSSSNGSMGRSSNGESSSGLQSPPRASAPNSPTQDDARRALDTLLTFLKQSSNVHGLVDREEYMAVVKLTEKLRLQSSEPLPGGLHRIVEQDCETPHKIEHV
ncbi:uncharacterized protein RSE6_12953 [Rhynchosporium secalis]|uniref:HTH CENPB-type domain-containing protein n=1 Tax=Rhynchosporium secalis TaxID=38038 RepID=A0A1E1MRR2_RHYSE|nr:uncharacterized protein RSE6_12953 [Rhynchosporium secalis]